MALLDLCAQVRGIPLYQMFTPAAVRAPRLVFTTDITIVLGSVEEARAAAQKFSARGFTAFKIKMGTDEELDLSRILALRQVAPGSALILDANMGFGAGRMLALLYRLDRNGARPLLLEQPVAKHDWEGLTA